MNNNEDNVTIENLKLQVEKLKVSTSTLAYLERLQNVTFEAYHGLDSDTGIMLVEDRGYSPMIRYTGDNRAFEPWEVLIMVDCSDFFYHACADYEYLETMEDYAILEAMGNMFISHYTNGEYPVLTLESSNRIVSVTEENHDEMAQWLGWSYSIIKRKSLPMSYWIDKMPEWLRLELDNYCDKNDIELYNPDSK